LHCTATAKAITSPSDATRQLALSSINCKLRAFRSSDSPYRESHIHHYCIAQSKLHPYSQFIPAAMAPNDSRYLLPMNSMLFREQPSPRPLATDYNPTLANLQDAQDTTVTALPQPPRIEEESSDKDVPSPKSSFCSSLLAVVKKLWPFGKGEKAKELSIGEPTEFRHLRTAGPRPLMGGVQTTEQEVDDEWEDME
jgi:hypothetical protein